jgi:uncharacterized protein YcbK (DUF882 family)
MLAWITAAFVATVGVSSVHAGQQEFPYDPIPDPPAYDPVPQEKPLPEPMIIDPLDVLNAHPPVPAEKAAPPVRAMPAKPQKQWGEKRLRLHSLHTGETVDVVFWRNGHYVPQGLRELKHMLRDHRSGDEIDMDPELFALVHRLYTDVGGKGAIQVISGHRSAKTNAMLRRIGRNVAKKSQHVLGTAMDIRIPGVPLKVLRDTALSYKAGGVGYYPQNDFIHVDTGRPRQW